MKLEEWGCNRSPRPRRSAGELRRGQEQASSRAVGTQASRSPWALSLSRRADADADGPQGRPVRPPAGQPAGHLFHSSGKATTPISNALALAGQGIRSELASAQFSGAALSATTDFAFTNATAAWNGLDMTRILSCYVEGPNPASKADRLTAMRQG